MHDGLTLLDPIHRSLCENVLVVHHSSKLRLQGVDVCVAVRSRETTNLSRACRDVNHRFHPVGNALAFPNEPASACFAEESGVATGGERNIYIYIERERERERERRKEVGEKEIDSKK